MSLDFYWKLSTASAENRHRGEWVQGDRPWTPARDAASGPLHINHYDYLTQIARVAELTGFDGILIPDDPQGEEPWIVTGTLIRETRRLHLITSVAPGSASAVYHGKMAASVQRFSADRQSWLVDLSLAADETPADAGALSPQEKAARAEEQHRLVDGIWGDTPYDQDGVFFTVAGGNLGDLVKGRKRPPLWLRVGADSAAPLVDAATVLLLPPTAPEDLPAAIASARARYGDRVRIAAEIAILTREDERDVADERPRHADTAHRLYGSYDAVAATIAGWDAAGLDILVATAENQIREVPVIGEQIIGRIRRGEASATAPATAVPATNHAA